ncbi:MAG: thioredoxin [Bacteroidales bacterium]|nr:thioredoxin [Bacteroidales bacterium]
MNSLLVLLFAFNAIACNNTQSNNTHTSDSTIKKKVEVYYFHGTRRCATCIAVGSVSQELVEIKYKDNPNVEFIEININEPDNEELAEKFQVSGSGLYVYNGKDIENITAYAFQHARANPDKLKKKLIELINKNL